MEGKAPIFVKISEYDEVLSTLESVKKQITAARDILARLDQLKVDEDRELAAWHDSLDDITHRVEQIDKSMGQQ